MMELPDIWRTELWHPMTVHFPIVLLLGAALIKILQLLVPSAARVADKMSRAMLYSGSIIVWITIYTGTLADSIVTRGLCDPTVLEAHENASFMVGYLFSGAALLDMLRFASLKLDDKIIKFLTHWLVTALLIGGGIYLAYTAHLGARLVYQQGAGVYHPTENCREFE